MLQTIAGYVIAFIVLAAIEIPFLPITISLSSALKKAKSLSPFITYALDAIKLSAAVIFSVWAIQYIGTSPSWMMFLIPGLVMVRNNLARINHVKNGTSNVKRMLEQNGEASSYDQEHDLRTEQAHLLGDVTGWIIGTNLALHSASFF